MRSALFALVLLGLGGLVCPAHAQWKQLPTTGSPENTLPDRTIVAGQSGLGPLLTARLVDEKSNAKKHRAVIETQVDGVRLVDPASVNYEPKLNQAHIEYRVDDGNVQQSASSTQTLENLTPGKHSIHVILVSNDNHRMGWPTTLLVDIP